MRTINKIIVVFLFACLGNLYGQSGEFVVQGIVQDSITSEIIEGASVILKQDARFLAFSYSDAKGVFKLSIPEFQENLVLVANSMGFAKQEISLLKDRQSYSIKLAPQVESLDEVLLQPDEKIVIKTDTLRYKVSAFTNKTEQTVEDVLRNIPGIEIDGDGNIKAQGQYIKKILIEGDDLADNNYKIISKNLDAQVLDEVEVISNYEENPVIKQFLNSDAKVLNLKLKEDRKTVLFGTNTAGIGNRKRSKLESNLGLIKEKIKFLNLGKWNNTGEWADEQLSNYVSENSSGFNDFDKDFSIKLDPQVYLQESTIMLDERNYIQNRSFFDHFLIHKPLSENTKLRAATSYINEELDQQFGGSYTYFLDDPITYNEQHDFAGKTRNFRNEIEISSAISKDHYLNFTNVVDLKSYASGTSLQFNNDLIDQDLYTQERNLETDINFSKKIKNGAMIIYGYVAHKNLDEDFTASPVSFLEADKAITGNYKTTLNYQGIEADFVFRKKKWSYSFFGGEQHLDEEFTGTSNEINAEIAIDSLSGGNDSRQLSFRGGLKLAYQINEKMDMNAKIASDIVDYRNSFFKDQYLIYNPELSYRWLKNSFGNFRLSYKFQQDLPRLSSLPGFGVLKSYRSIQYGAQEVELLKSHRYSLSYILNKVKDRFLLSSTLSYVDYQNSFLRQNFIAENYNFSSLFYTNSEDFLNLNAGVTTFIDKLNMTAKLGINQMWFTRPSVLNNQFSLIKNESQNLYLRGTTYFKGNYDFYFQLNYMRNSGEIEGNLTNIENYSTSFENVFRINDKIFLNLKNELFLVDNQFFESSLLNAEYRPKHSNWTFGFNAQNLFNTQYYRFQNINNFERSELRYKSVARFILAYAKWRI